MGNLHEVIDLLEVPEMYSLEFSNIGFVDTGIQDTLTFVEKETFLKIALDNPNISRVLVKKSIFERLPSDTRLIPCKSPQYAFVKLHNFYGENGKPYDSSVDASARISSSAHVATKNVTICEGVVIEDFCVVYENSIIEKDAVLRAGCIVGATALYIGKGIENRKLNAKHFGMTRIGQRVEIGPNTVIDRGMFCNDSTTIGSDNFIGPLCNISHSVNIGTGNILAAGAKISGYTSIGDNNWIGPSSTISHKLVVGSNNYLALGSTLLRSITDNNKVVGNRIFDSGFPQRD